ncbi:MAG: hypothetical protein AAGP08_16080 [Pseudomonadota bacterium]
MTDTENEFIFALEKTPAGKYQVILNPEALDYPEASGELLHVVHLYLAEAFLQAKKVDDFMEGYKGVTSGYTQEQAEWVQQIQKQPPGLGEET